jgi:hypothetical protein
MQRKRMMNNQRWLLDQLKIENSKFLQGGRRAQVILNPGNNSNLFSNYKKFTDGTDYINWLKTRNFAPKVPIESVKNPTKGATKKTIKQTSAAGGGGNMQQNVFGGAKTTRRKRNKTIKSKQKKTRRH